MMRECCAIADYDENHCSLVALSLRTRANCRVAQEGAFHRSRRSRSESSPRLIIVDAGSSWNAGASRAIASTK